MRLDPLQVTNARIEVPITSGMSAIQQSTLMARNAFSRYLGLVTLSRACTAERDLVSAFETGWAETPDAGPRLVHSL